VKAENRAENATAVQVEAVFDASGGLVGCGALYEGHLVTARHAASGDNESVCCQPMNPVERAMLGRP